MNQTGFYPKKPAYETDSMDLSEMLKSSDGVIVIDTGSPEAYAIEPIPGAINIPHRTMSSETAKYLDITRLYVTYCEGIGCNASSKGSLNMSKPGFNVKELLGGLDWWKRDGYETEGTNGSEG